MNCPVHIFFQQMHSRPSAVQRQLQLAPFIHIGVYFPGGQGFKSLAALKILNLRLGQLLLHDQGAGAAKTHAHLPAGVVELLLRGDLVRRHGPEREEHGAQHKQAGQKAFHTRPHLRILDSFCKKAHFLSFANRCGNELFILSSA